MVAILRPFEEVITSLYEIKHTIGQLKELAEVINTLDGETRVVLEHTGKYCEPVVKAGIFVSAVNPLLIKEYGNNSIRRSKLTQLMRSKLPNTLLTTGLIYENIRLWKILATNLKPSNGSTNFILKTKLPLRTIS